MSMSIQAIPCMHASCVCVRADDPVLICMLHCMHVSQRNAECIAVGYSTEADQRREPVPTAEPLEAVIQYDGGGYTETAK